MVHFFGFQNEKIYVFNNGYLFAGVITEKELNSDESFEYIYRVNKHDVFKCKNRDCDLIYNNSNNYCQNLSSLQDELEANIRARWICPKVYAFHDLYKKYKIRLTDDVAFSDYILNLYRIMENGKYSISNSSIKINKFKLQVGISPDAFFIPDDVNDVISAILIRFNNDGFITEENYRMDSGESISRLYKYDDKKIVEIMTFKVKGNKKLYSIKSYFKYD